MQKLIILSIALLSLSGFSQQVERRKGRFYSDGKQISTRETRQLLAANEEALRLFKSGKGRESLGGFLIGFGGALVVADVVVGLVSDVNYPTAATYIGAGCVIASVPILSGKNRRIDAGLDLYNKGQKSIGENEVEFNVIANQNGYGVQLRF